jgi:hypothetical protein
MVAEFAMTPLAATDLIENGGSPAVLKVKLSDFAALPKALTEVTA